MGGQGGRAPPVSQTHYSPKELRDLEPENGPPPSQEVQGQPQIMEVLLDIQNTLTSNSQITNELYEIFTQILQQFALPPEACRDGGLIHKRPRIAPGCRSQGWGRIATKHKYIAHQTSETQIIYSNT
ncbi:hypothetical protein JTB14_025833 [Gonioctena quinquepunctata]|nr:hypothetical protein JTB14_025833 [Gonioctena quinquepunctata]